MFPIILVCGGDLIVVGNVAAGGLTITSALIKEANINRKLRIKKRIY